jgi:hypothetical protein
MSGSLNLTHNGLQNNKEHLYRLSEPEFIQEMTADFERDWTLGEDVGEREISIMLAKDMTRKEERQASTARTIPIRQSTAEPGTTLEDCMRNPNWRNQLDLDIKDGCPVAFRMATPDGSPVAFRPRQVDTVGPAQHVPPQQPEHFPKPSYVSVGTSRSKDVSRFDGASGAPLSVTAAGKAGHWNYLPSRVSSQPRISGQKEVHISETQVSQPKAAVSSSVWPGASVPSTIWSDRGPGGLTVSDAKEKCERLMMKRITDEKKEGGGRPSARGQGTVESYVNAEQQRESAYEMDIIATGGLLSTCRVPPKRFLAESGSSNHP